jgi:hypothetical protein
MTTAIVVHVDSNNAMTPVVDDAGTVKNATTDKLTEGMMTHEVNKHVPGEDLLSREVWLQFPCLSLAFTKCRESYIPMKSSLMVS